MLMTRYDKKLIIKLDLHVAGIMFHVDVDCRFIMKMK
jgi:hypothetical protein